MQEYLKAAQLIFFPQRFNVCCVQKCAALYKKMKNPFSYTSLSALALVIMLSLFSCKKSSDASIPDERVSVYLSDDPVQYNNVFIDIKYVEVKVQERFKTVEHVGDKDDDDDDHFDDDDNDLDDDNKSKDNYGKWDTLAIRSGIYDILKFRNGVDTLFGQGTVKGRVRKIRLTLGDRNSVVVSGNTYPLSLKSGINKYVYVKIHNRHHDVLGVNHYGYWLDFNLTNSIIEESGRYFLKPEIKPFSNNYFGKVSGKVFPDEARTLVKIYNSIMAGAAIPEKSGEYKIRGLAEGTYKITFKGSNGFMDTTINDIKVFKNRETKIPDIRLHR